MYNAQIQTNIVIISSSQFTESSIIYYVYNIMECAVY